MKAGLFAVGLGAVPAAFAQIGSFAWDAAYAKAAPKIALLSTHEKVNIVTGQGFFTANCTGATWSAPTIGFPGFCLQDGPLGLRSVKNNSAFPAGINTAATFDRQLIRQRGEALGAEYKGKGVHVYLGPMTNMMRAPAAGRNWEGFGGDPYLAGEAVYETVAGVQSQGVQAVVKHLLNNEQEHQRMFSSSNVDDRTNHELYLQPFVRALQADVASVMCSYNQINGTYACSNDKMLNGVFKGEMGFRGYVVSDWLATHGTTDANQGLDMDMPGGILSEYFGLILEGAVASKSVPEARVTDMATRVLAAWYLLGQDTYPPLNLNADVQGDHGILIRTIGAASTVLLKNTGGALPLKSQKTIAVIGSSSIANPDGINACSDKNCNKGALAMGWGSGSAGLPYLVAPLDAINATASSAGATVTTSTSDSDLKAARAAATGKDVALVFITADSGEASSTVEGSAGDRKDLKAWHGGDDLVNAVASVNKNTIVVVHTVGPIIVEPWINNPNVTALVWAGLPGQELGNSLVDILWGAVNPSGRLPYTIAKADTDYPAKVDYTSISISPIQIDYKEGLAIDYRWFDQNNIAPRFEFGFGLSYTTFAYSGISISGSVGSYTPPSGNGSTLDASLHAKAYTVTFNLKNSGSVAGKEIPQLYLSPPASAKTPPFLLKGFDSVLLNPGQSKSISFSLTRYDLSNWNVVTQRWEIPSGTFKVTVGASSRDGRLTGSFTV